MTGHKLLLSQKYSLISYKTSQEDVCQKEELMACCFEDEIQGDSKLISFSCIEF